MNTTHRFIHVLPALAAVVLTIATARAHDGHAGAHEPDFPVVMLLAQAGPASSAASMAPTVAGTTNRISVTIEGDKRVIRANGIPDHAPGQFPRRGNPNTISAQNYTLEIPLKPVVSQNPGRTGPAWFGIAVNGVPFEAGTAETWNQNPAWRYEAIGGSMNLGLDQHLAHVQPTGAYHYHGLPKGLLDRLGDDGKKMTLVGWAGDGFPIYSSYAYTDAANAGSAVKKVRSSYRLISGNRPAEPDGPGGKFDGAFTADHEFVKGLGDLDEFNGRTGVTPEFPQGTYYYCLTAEFPFIARQWRGVPDQTFLRKGGPPGGMRGGKKGGPPGGPGGPGGPRGGKRGGPPGAP